MDLCEPSLDQGKKASFVLLFPFPIIVLRFHHIVYKRHRALFRIDCCKLGKYSGVILHVVIEQMLDKGELIVKANLKILGQTII